MQSLPNLFPVDELREANAHVYHLVYLYKQKHLWCKKVAWPRKTTVRLKGLISMWPRCQRCIAYGRVAINPSYQKQKNYWLVTWPPF